MMTLLKKAVISPTCRAILPALNHAAGTRTWESSKKTVTTQEDDEPERQ